MSDTTKTIKAILKIYIAILVALYLHNFQRDTLFLKRSCKIFFLIETVVLIIKLTQFINEFNFRNVSLKTK